MQCPKCKHEADAEAFGVPAQCPACGAIYSKVLIQQKAAAKTAEAAAPASKLDAPGSPQSKILKGFAGAKAEVVEVRKSREIAQAASAPGRVVLVDIDIGFWSLVQLLVKVALAMIPATIIFVVILWGIKSIISLL